MPCGYRQAFEVREVECSSGTSGLVRKGEREMEYCPSIFLRQIFTDENDNTQNRVSN